MKKRILFVGGTTGGGVATINNEVIRIFREEGHDCRLVDTEDMKSRWPAAVAYLVSYALTLARIVSFRPRVVYLQIAQTGYLHQSIFLLLAKLTGRETVAHFHAKSKLRETCTAGQFRTILRSERYIDRMILLTEACRRSLTGGGWRKPTWVVPNFISTDALPRSVAPVQERKKCLYIGRMDREKGVFEILEVARLLPGEEFLFVGNFADPEQERQFRRELEGTGNASWLGPIYDERKYAVIAQSKILVFPTRRDEFPMTLIEATILGCVPLVSPVGSVGEIVQDGVNGVFIEPGDAEGIARRIRELGSGEDLRRMSENGAAYARAHFTSDAVRERLLEVVG